ncbi:MAG: DUF2924 domain-containing protein [bacterium]|nr:DUF2924 domain-containing protein [bacterium]
MDSNIVREINRLRQMTVAELREEWFRLYGEPTRSRNRTYLWRRLAWRVQEMAHGGLDGAVRAKIDDLAIDDFVRARTPVARLTTISGTPGAERRPEPRRDPRLPTPGTVLTRSYHGGEIRVVVRDDGFEWNDQMYGSLSAVARAVTGSKWNGRLFFGLTQRKR